VGSVTNSTGSVKGKSLIGLTDAYTGNWSGSGGTYDTTSPSLAGQPAQVQHVVMLSDQAGACSRKGSGGAYGSLELTLRFSMVAYADVPADVATIPLAADVPLTFQANTLRFTSDGAHRELLPYVMQASRNGNPGSDTQATSGTVTLTRADSTAYEGSYDLMFGSDHVTGSFAAPWC
jgi:hypothetical protein